MKQPDKCPKLILASKSPRRRYLLKQAGLEFSVIPSSFDESSVSLSTPDSFVRRIAEGKAKDMSEKYPDSWIIGADTVVVIDKKILGKPGSRTEARSMLSHLNGKTHRVLTGYCIRCKAINYSLSATVQTDVCFKTLSEKEIDWYISTGEPFDKAGAYAIQGIGAFLVKRINGSYTNVVGLPVCEIVDVLINAGVMDLQIEKHADHKELK
ncbi:MAG: Maf family protein [Desulfobacterales bacterium]|jgi:septum formation protein